MKLFVAIKTFIEHRGKVLIVRESSMNPVGTNPGKFDVVGGRVEPGERFDTTLLREVQEETGLTVAMGRPFYVAEWRPVVGGEEWQIIAVFFRCQSRSDCVVLSRDHDAYEWIDPTRFRGYPIIGNLREVFEAYLDRRTRPAGGDRP